MAPQVPPGYRFDPSDIDLVEYLKGKVAGEKLSDGIIKDCYDLYDKNPWELFDKNSSGYVYVFCKLKRKSKAKLERTAGSGTWKNQTRREISDNNGKSLGFKKTFEFKVNKEQGTVVNNGHWLMKEFSLMDQGFEHDVICRISNKEDSQKSKDVVIEEKELTATAGGQAMIAYLNNKRKLPAEGGHKKPKRMKIGNSSKGTEIDGRENVREPSFPPNLIAKPASAQRLAFSPEEIKSCVLASPNVTSENGLPVSIKEGGQSPTSQNIVAGSEDNTGDICFPSNLRVEGENFVASEHGDLTSLFSDIDSDTRRTLEAELDKLLAVPNYSMMLPHANLYSSMAPFPDFYSFVAPVPTQDSYR